MELNSGTIYSQGIGCMSRPFPKPVAAGQALGGPANCGRVLLTTL